MKRRRKLLLMVGAMVLVAVVAMLLMRPHGDFSRKLEAYKQQLRVQGEMLTLAEAAPAYSPKLTNAAMRFFGDSNFFSGSVSTPLMMSPLNNGYAQVMHTNRFSTNAQQREFMMDLRQVLAEGPINLNLNYTNFIDLNLSHLPRIRMSENIAISEAMGGLSVAINEPGNTLSPLVRDQAFTNLCAAVDVVRLHNREPMLISALVRIANLNLASAATWEFLQEDCWTDGQLAGLQAKWEDMDLFKMAAPSVELERAVQAAEFARARSYSNKRQLLTNMPPTSTMATASNTVVLSQVPRKLRDLYDSYPAFWTWKSSWSFDEELYSLQTAQVAVEAARRAAMSNAFLPELAELRRQSTNIQQEHAAVMGHHLGFVMTDYSTFLTRIADAEVVRRVIVTAMALKRYRMQHGNFPAKLEELVPEFLKSVPIDFMDGQPLRYRVLPDGNYLLYSIGTDGKDNGGDRTVIPGSGGINWWTRGVDFVWPRAATQEQIHGQTNRSSLK